MMRYDLLSPFYFGRSLWLFRPYVLLCFRYVIKTKITPSWWQLIGTQSNFGLLSISAIISKRYCIFSDSVLGSVGSEGAVVDSSHDRPSHVATHLFYLVTRTCTSLSFFVWYDWFEDFSLTTYSLAFLRYSYLLLMTRPNGILPDCLVSYFLGIPSFSFVPIYI